MRRPSNIPASIRQRLLNKAREDKRPFQELLQYFAMERFLYRLSQSAHAGRFVLKGALLLQIWHSPQHSRGKPESGPSHPRFRPTMDIDMLGMAGNQDIETAAHIQDIVSVKVEEDGLAFDPDAMSTERITEDADSEGVRVRLPCMLDTARITLQIDIGFGDRIHPGPEEGDLPAMLDFPAPRLLCYSRESVIAEKFEIMVTFGRVNSRMKDFYDIWILQRQFDFELSELAEAVRLTFERRGTTLPDNMEFLDEDFVQAKQAQWSAFRKRLQQEYIPDSFRDVVSDIKKFLHPVVLFLSTRNS